MSSRLGKEGILLEDMFIWVLLPKTMTSYLRLFLAPVIILSSMVGIQAVDAQSVENGYGIVHGPGYAFSIKAPAGWVIDSNSGLGQGLPAVFYPKGGSWEGSPVIAYARSRPRAGKIATVEDAVKFVLETFHNEGFPKYSAKFIKIMKTDEGKDAAIYYFSGDKWGDSEATAYFLEPKNINFVTINARNEELFKDSMPAFEELVKSYTLLAVKAPMNQ